MARRNLSGEPIGRSLKEMSRKDRHNPIAEHPVLFAEGVVGVITIAGLTAYLARRYGKRAKLVHPTQYELMEEEMRELGIDS